MNAVVDFLGQVFVEFLAYSTGKVVLRVFAPTIRIDVLDRQKAWPNTKWRGFIYKRGKTKYFYTETIQIAGLLFWTVLAIAIFVISTYAT